MADVEFEKRENIMVAYLKGDIDHHSVQKLRIRIDSEILLTSPKITVLDFSQVGFMDSSGVGLILGRNRLAQTLNLRLQVQAVPENLTKILKLAGIAHNACKYSEVDQ